MPDTVNTGADRRERVRIAAAISVLVLVLLTVVFVLLYRDAMAVTDIVILRAAFDKVALVGAVAVLILSVALWVISRKIPSLGGRVISDDPAAGAKEAAEAEQELSKSQTRFQALIENTADITILFGPDGGYLYVSPSLTRISGLRPEEIIGHSMREFLHPIDQEMFADTLKNALENPGESLVLPEYRVVLPDGTMVFYEGLMTGLPADAGMEGVVLNARDLTERRAAAKILAENETKFRAITENTSDITSVIGLDGSYQYISPAIGRKLGYSEAQMYESRLSDFIDPADMPILEGGFLKSADNAGETFSYPQIRAKHADGHTLYFDIQLTSLLDVPGVAGIVTHGRDVTERVMAENDIRAANLLTQSLQSRLNDAIESFVDGFMLFDSDDRLVLCNSALEEEFQSIADYLKPGTLYKDILRAALIEKHQTLAVGVTVEQALAARLAHHDNFGFEPRVTETRDGRWVMINEYRTHDGGFAMIRSDVTKRIVAEQESIKAKELAEQAQALMKDAIESIADGFALYNADDRFVLCNTAYRQEFPELPEYLVPGVSFEDFVRAIYSSGETVAADYLSENVAERRLAVHRSRKSEPWTLQTADDRWVMVHEYPTHDGGTALVRSDVTGRVEAEQLVVAAKDEAVSASQAKSEFLSSMSHELRTPMNAIMGFTQLLDFESANLTESQKGYVAEIMKAGGHLMDLIVDVLNLSRIEVGEMDVQLTDLAVREIVDECLPMTRVTAAERDITLIDRSADRVLPTVRADSVRLKQVLLNILSNAVKYNAEGGEILFDCEQTSRNTLRFRVTDTGPGIPEDMFDRLFEPFDRLGAENSSVLGTGVGLTITKRIVDLMNGEIRVDSEVGKGSTFWIELPTGGSTCHAEANEPNKEAVAKP